MDACTYTPRWKDQRVLDGFCALIENQIEQDKELADKIAFMINNLESFIILHFELTSVEGQPHRLDETAILCYELRVLAVELYAVFCARKRRMTDRPVLQCQGCIVLPRTIKVRS